MSGPKWEVFKEGKRTWKALCPEWFNGPCQCQHFGSWAEAMTYAHRMVKP